MLEAEKSTFVQILPQMDFSCRDEGLVADLCPLLTATMGLSAPLSLHSSLSVSCPLYHLSRYECLGLLWIHGVRRSLLAASISPSSKWNTASNYLDNTFYISPFGPGLLLEMSS